MLHLFEPTCFYLNSLSHGHQWPNFLSFLERPSLKKAKPGPKNRVRDDHQHQQALIPVEIDEALEQVSSNPLKFKRQFCYRSLANLEFLDEYELLGSFGKFFLAKY